MSGDIWGSYYKPPPRRRKYVVPPVTREDCEAAVAEYLMEGGKITRLDKSPNPGKIAQMSGSRDFTSCEGLSLTDIF